MSEYSKQVFVNCPFDDAYRTLFEAIVFTISDCGLRPRCALEVDDSSQVRMQTIFDIISACKFGIHDLSRTELDDKNRLPRFNMPLELGMFLGAKRFGSSEQQEKICLIMDRESYRYQTFISDISGQGVHKHGDDPKQATTIVRDWLRNASPISIPGGEAIWSRYQSFRKRLPSMCRKLKLNADKLTFVDYTWLVSTWIDKYKPQASSKPT